MAIIVDDICLLLSYNIKLDHHDGSISLWSPHDYKQASASHNGCLYSSLHHVALLKLYRSTIFGKFAQTHALYSITERSLVMQQVIPRMSNVSPFPLCVLGMAAASAFAPQC